MDYSVLSNISPFIRCIRAEEKSVFGNWLDYDNVLTYVESGTFEYVAKGKTYLLNSGDCILVPPRTPHIVKTPGNSVTYYVMHFDYFYNIARTKLKIIGTENYIDKCPDEILFPENEIPLNDEIYFATLDEISRLHMTDNLIELLKLCRENAPLIQLSIKARLLDALVIMFNCYDIDNRFKEKTTSFWPTVNRVLRHINTYYYDQDLDLDAVSKVVGTSKNYLSAEFKKVTGVSVYSYILNVRISKAKELIILGEQSITEIAEHVGFSSIHSFCRTFKNTVGISPKKFYSESQNELNRPWP